MNRRPRTATGVVGGRAGGGASEGATVGYRPTTAAGGRTTRSLVVVLGVLALGLGGCLDGSRAADGGEEDGAADADDGATDGTDGSDGADGTDGSDGSDGSDGTADDGTTEEIDWRLPPTGPGIPEDAERDVYLVLETSDPRRCRDELARGDLSEPPPSRFSTGERSFHLYTAGAHLCADDRDAARTAFGAALATAWVEPTIPRTRGQVCAVWDAVVALVDPGAGPCELRAEEETTDDGATDDDGTDGETDDGDADGAVDGDGGDGTVDDGGTDGADADDGDGGDTDPDAAT